VPHSKQEPHSKQVPPRSAPSAFVACGIGSGGDNTFMEKYTAVLSTSIHFYDHTAHNYINALCDDLNMKYVGSFFADMPDRSKKKKE
jgi:hypothetical protein